MRRIRFHLGTLVLLVLVVGVAFAALRESSPIWESAVFTLTVGVLLFSTLLAIHRTRRRRAFWLGFALFGASYLLLSLVPSIERRLITTKALAELDSKVSRSTPAGVGLAFADYDNDGEIDLFVTGNSPSSTLYYHAIGNGLFEDVTAKVGLNLAGDQATGNGGFFVNSLGKLSLRASVGTTENFVRIGHSLIALILALTGGSIARHVYAPNGRAVVEEDS
jgi:hypothetical protein